MHDRIGELHLSYRFAPQDATATARAPMFDRALQAALPEVLGARLALAFGGDSAVTVIRTLDAPITLDSADTVFDTRLVERVCRNTIDAVAKALAKPANPDDVMRFADDAEFAGSFIMDLLAGRAWERWYFGAFRGYRRTHLADTLRALLTANDINARKVLAWLAKHDALDPVLELLGTDAVHSLLTAETTSSSELGATTGAPALAAAGFELLRRWGLEPFAPTERERLLARFLDHQHQLPDWRDRRALSQWLFEWIRFIRTHIDRQASAVRPGGLEAIRSLLDNEFDWLDGPWLIERLERLLDATKPPAAAASASRPPGLEPAQAQELKRVTERIASGRLRVEATIRANALAVRLLIAAAEASSRSGPADRAVAVAIAEISGAYVALSRFTDASLLACILAQDSAPPITIARLPEEAARRLERVRSLGTEARALLHALLTAQLGKQQTGLETEGAGIYLITRVLEDLRFMALARVHEVPLAPLLAGLAEKWFGLRPPFDTASALWITAAAPDSASLNHCQEGLAALATALLNRLLEQHVLDTELAHASFERDAADLIPATDLHPSADVLLSRIAVLLLRGWARWLPAVRDSSLQYLIQQCLRRRATAVISETAVELELESAPLDVVVEMAGYFRPIERVAWLDNRSISFHRPSQASAAPP